MRSSRLGDAVCPLITVGSRRPAALRSAAASRLMQSDTAIIVYCWPSYAALTWLKASYRTSINPHDQVCTACFLLAAKFPLSSSRDSWCTRAAIECSEWCFTSRLAAT